MKILLIEDDAETADHVRGGLAELGHAVSLAESGGEALRRAVEDSYDLLIVDRMLPELDGLSVVRTLRAKGLQTPVLFLTALGSVGDRVLGLNAGGDDYLAKPFALAELAARIAALGRRPRKSAADGFLRVADLEIDLAARRVCRAGRTIDLLPREFRLLDYLMRHGGQVVTRMMLLENVWDLEFDPRTNVVETHVSRLRGKIDRGFGALLIHTVRGEGYVIREPD